MSDKHFSFNFPLFYNRRKTYQVSVGNILIGSENPIRIQSMTNTKIEDIEGTINQIKKLYDAGCEIVRFAIPSKSNVQHCKIIAEKLSKEKLHIPIVADVHFLPELAIELAPIVAKIRINPGNYGVLKRKRDEVYSNAELIKEKELVYNNFIILVNLLKQYGTALRIGVNHGSLSARMVHQYGNTDEGMVESAMEMLRWCIKEDFYNCIISLKASNVEKTIDVNRLLVHKMNEEQMLFPLHLGVTEAGTYNEGRIKSAVGIGTLLADGIGDTIRVSLTEDPILEIPVAKEITSFFQNIDITKKEPSESTYNYHKCSINNIYTVEQSISEELLQNEKQLLKIINTNLDQHKPWEIIQFSDDDLIRNNLCNINKLKNDSLTTEFSIVINDINMLNSELIKMFDKVIITSEILTFILNNQSLINILSDKYIQIALQEKDFNIYFEKVFKLFPKKYHDKIIWSVEYDNNPSYIYSYRKLYALLSKLIPNPNIALSVTYKESDNSDIPLSYIIQSGSLIVDNIIQNFQLVNNNSPLKNIDIIYDLLHYTGKRIVKAEFIACPTCGRTNYNVKAVLERIKDKTKHLVGVKIAVMGCIVNGPGEMADADFGYIGSAKGLVSIYVKSECVRKNIPEIDADNVLIEIIKSENKWIEPFI